MIRLICRRYFIILLVALGFIITATEASAHTPAPSIRIYGPADQRAGDPMVKDKSGIAPEDLPYTGITGTLSIFNPEGEQAPPYGSLLWNPAWMYENETLDENQKLGLYRDIFSHDLNISEQTAYRLWYEPDHQDIPVLLGEANASSYPAIVQEFTYLLMESPAYGALGDINDMGDRPAPQPISGPAGKSTMVFPVGIKGKDWDDEYGYGLTSFDANFDNIPDIVEIHSEQSLIAITGEPGFDFNNDDNIFGNQLNDDGLLLSGDEMVVLSLPPRFMECDVKLQFLDHAIEISAVLSDSVSLTIWYTGDIIPVAVKTETLHVGDAVTYNTRSSGIPTDVTDYAQGPFFVHILSVDRDKQIAQVRIGRALGGAHANVASDEPSSSLKRFYVDGHAYNVVAIGTEGKDALRFITLRTPLPTLDVPVTLPAHSVRLQNYNPGDQLATVPPFNQEHYFLKNIQKEHSRTIIGEKIGPVPPVLQGNGAGYWGAYSQKSGVDYRDMRAMRFTYTHTGTYTPFQGVMDAARPGVSTWEAHIWNTQPITYIELVLPDVQGTHDLFFVTTPYTASDEAEGLVKFWFDPAESENIYSTPYGLRLYGANGAGAGAGDQSVISDSITLSGTTPLNGAYVVEVPPYTEVTATLDVLHEQAPLNDFMTFNPILMSEFTSCDDPLFTPLHSRIGINSDDARERVFFRMWYEPVHLDPVLASQKGLRLEDFYSVLMQEYTYLLTKPDMEVQPAQPRWSELAFPIGTTFKELQDPFGYGLTTFDSNFDGLQDDTVVIHSEQSLFDVTGIEVNFDGDAKLDQLDNSSDQSGDEMVILTLADVKLTLDGKDESDAYAMLLDHMVQLVNITPEGLVQLQIWNTGGGLDPISAGNYEIKPTKVGSTLPYWPGQIGIVGQNKVNVTQLGAEEVLTNTVAGGWFVFVNGSNPGDNTITVSIGRALGATTSALYTGTGRHDLANGSPGYLKHFYVDGHRYDVVAINTPQCTADDCVVDYGFTSITIRTPVPMRNFENAFASQLLQGYLKVEGEKPIYRTLSVMPPYNFEHHSISNSISATAGEESSLLRGTCRPPLEINIDSQAQETRFVGELKGIVTQRMDDQNANEALTWDFITFETTPNQYACLSLSAKQAYHVTTSWLDTSGTRAQFWYEPGVTQDIFVNPESMSLPTTAQPKPSDNGRCVQSYTVQAGDSVAKIATAYGTTIQAIVDANDLKNVQLIYVGQNLFIPVCYSGGK